MPSPRWRKVLRDLWGNKRRTVLVVLSIAVGVFAVGAVAHMQAIVQRDMVGSYEAAVPASATIYTEDPFDEDLVEVIRDMPEVAEAEGRRSVVVRFQSEGDEAWYPMELFAIPDYEDMRVNVLQPEAEFGPEPDAWPGPVPLRPPERQVLLERTSCVVPRTGCAFKVELGDTLLIETPAGRRREMRTAGLVADYARYPATWMIAYGYVTFDTMEWLDLPSTYDELVLLVAGDRGDVEYVEQVAEEVADRVERSGVTVLRTYVPEPGKLPLDFLIDGLLYLLSAIGVLSLFSSAFLLINTVQALLAQQVQQIGVMKALGARARQILGMYLSIILVYGVLAILIAVPLGTWAARWIINFMAYFVNFELGDFYVPPQVLALEVAMGLLVPLLAGLWPILSGVRITVREAISSYGLGEEEFGTDLVDRLVEQVRGLPRPLLLSLRNTFRRKGRLALTLVTLTLVGTIFLSVVVVRASMQRTVDDIYGHYRWDVLVSFERPYRVERLEDAALGVRGVVAVESWASEAPYRLRPDGSEGEAFALEGPPTTSGMFDPTVIEGRWLRPEDENALVVNTYWLDEEPDVEMGDEIVLDLRGRERTWRVVGIVQPAQPGPQAYANYDYLTRLVREAGQANSVFVVTERHDGEFQAQVKEALETYLDEQGLNVSIVRTVAEDRQGIGQLFDILVTFLMGTAILLAVVGGIGLMGTMLLNVLERVREIGVMRAIGASNGTVIQIFIVEGVVIGLISWSLSMVFALLLGRVVGETTGVLLLGVPLSYAFPLSGALIWLALSIALSILASYLPAQNAAQVTVREVLAYY
jgi:putative ABC transport system permease protein